MVDGPEDTRRRVAGGPDADTSRGTATVLFTDLVGSSEMIAQLGDIEGVSVQLAHLALLRGVVARYGGREIKNVGDGLMVAFDGPRAAVDCAVAMQQTTAAESAGADRPALGLRVGINTGEAIHQRGDLYGAVVVVARRLCEFADGGQILISALVAALLGDRGGDQLEELGSVSLRGFEGVRAVLAVHWDDAGTPPRPRASGRPAFPRALQQQAASAIVGREQPLQELGVRYRECAGGGRHLSLLAGEPGIGKTRLAAETARVAHDLGAIVLFGRCDEEALVPYQPFVTGLDSYVAMADTDRLRFRLGARALDLARLLPSLRGDLRADRGAAGEDPETARYRVFEAVVALLGIISERAPVVLVLDDLHWADRETLLLLRHVMRAARPLRLFVLATYRDVEVLMGHPLTLLLADLRRESGWDRIALSGLSQPEVHALVEAASAGTVTAEVAHDIWRETEGHPFFVQELIRHLGEVGALRDRRGRVQLRRSLERAGIPEGVREIVTGRLRRLPPPTRELLSTAAVIGREFSPRTLEALTGRSRQDLLDLLEPALAGQLLTPAGDGLERFAFSHGLIRDALYEELPVHRRPGFHLRVGRALEQRAAAEGPGGGRLAELAHHFLLGASEPRDRVRAVDYAVHAAEREVDGLAFERACDHYRAAIGMLGRVADSHARRCELLLALGENEWKAGEYSLSRATFGRAGELAEDHRFGAQLARAALGFGGRIGFQASAPDAELVALLERALRLLGPERSALRTRVAGRLALALMHFGESERQARLSEESVADARALGDEALLVEVLSYAGWARWSPDNLEERLATAEEIVSLADRAGPVSLRLESRFWRMAHLLEAHRLDLAEDDLVEFARLAQQARQPYHLWLTGVVRAMQALAAGSNRVALERMWEAFHKGEATQNSAAMQVFSGQLLVGYGFAQRSGEFLGAARAMTEYFHMIALYQAGMALTLCRLGRAGEARAHFERLAADDFADVPRDWLWLSTMDLLCETCVLLGDTARARVLYRLLAPYAERNVVLGGWAAPRGIAARAVGLVAALAGELDQAIGHFEAAVRVNGRLGILPAVAVAKLDLARALGERGTADDRARARALATETLEEAEQMELTSLLEPARALAAALGPPPPRSLAAARVGARAMHARAPRAPLRERAAELGDRGRAALSVRGRELIARRFSETSEHDLELRFAHPLAQRALFTAMARAFQPRLAEAFEGDISFALYHADESRRPDWWTLRVAGGRATARRRRATAPAMLAHLRIPDFLRLVTGERNPIELWVEKDVRVDGDILLAPRLVEMFGGATLAGVIDAQPPAAPEPYRQSMYSK